MLKTSLEVLKIIEKRGYECYIVGGFVRDYYMNKEAFDVDICTNAKPKDLLEIFSNASLPKEKYGAVTLFYKSIRYEITTFRKELTYENRKPIEIEYTDNFKEDISRRDFYVNTLCMNSNGDIIDLLDGKKDIDNKIIRVVGDPNKKFNEDPLRILRAIRFATQLNFSLDESVVLNIKNNAELLRTLSYQRKMGELNKIFVNKNVKYGLDLLKRLEVDKYLDLYGLDNIKITTNVLGFWSQLDINNLYLYSSLDLKSIQSIREIIRLNKITKREVYVYGLYVCSIVAEILGVSKKYVTKLEKSLSIHSIKDINITSDEILNILNKEPGNWLRELYKDIEYKIVDSKLKNNNNEIKKYIMNNY
jgi:tRNA nucleotidyltransferase (CCA-adding enzyme)